MATGGDGGGGGTGAGGSGGNATTISAGGAAVGGSGGSARGNITRLCGRPWSTPRQPACDDRPESVCGKRPPFPGLARLPKTEPPKERRVAALATLVIACIDNQL